MVLYVTVGLMTWFQMFFQTNKQLCETNATTTIKTCKGARHIEFKHNDRTFIIVERSKPINFKIFDSMHIPTAIEHSRIMLVETDDGEDVTDTFEKYAGPSGDFYASIGYEVLLHDVCSHPVTITDTMLRGHYFADPMAILKLKKM